MQTNYPVMLHKSKMLFKKFCYDMEVLPSYTPLFLVDSQGRIIEKRKLSIEKDDFLNIVSLTAEDDKTGLAEGMLLHDVFTVEAKAGRGKDFIVVSKDTHGFSRCVVCSSSDRGCVRLHDYLERLSCYKDYLDSFSHLSFSPMARTPALRIFKSRISGASELLRLSEFGNECRMLSFPLKLALEKLSGFAVAASGDTKCRIDLSMVGGNIAVKASENFFKLVISLLGLEMREAKSDCIKLSSHLSADGKSIYINFIADADEFESRMFKDALVKAFRRSGFDVFTSADNGKIGFSVGVEIEKKTAEVLSDSERILGEIDFVLSDEIIRNLYLMTADI